MICKKFHRIPATIPVPAKLLLGSWSSLEYVQTIYTQCSYNVYTYNMYYIHKMYVHICRRNRNLLITFVLTVLAGENVPEITQITLILCRVVFVQLILKSAKSQICFCYKVQFVTRFIHFWSMPHVHLDQVVLNKAVKHCSLYCSKLSRFLIESRSKLDAYFLQRVVPSVRFSQSRQLTNFSPG